MELSERIALARKQAGLTQEQLGEALGVSRQAVSKWEAGQSNPDVAYVAEMCRLFGVSSDWLLLGEEQARERAPLECPGCKSVVTGLDKFCPNCGRSLQGAEEERYTLLMRQGDHYLAGQDLQDLSSLDFLTREPPMKYNMSVFQAEEAAKQAPFIVGKELNRSQVTQALERVNYSEQFGVYHSREGEDPIQLARLRPLDSESFRRVREPLSFGMVVVAVMLAVVAAVLLLSFL